MQGKSNHAYLTGYKLLGSGRTKPIYTLLDNGMYPAVKEKGKTAVYGEIYEIDDECLQRIDYLEGIEEAYYMRKMIRVENHICFIYVGKEVFFDHSHWDEIPSGDYRLSKAMVSTLT